MTCPTVPHTVVRSSGYIDKEKNLRLSRFVNTGSRWRLVTCGRYCPANAGRVSTRADLLSFLLVALGSTRSETVLVYGLRRTISRNTVPGFAIAGDTLNAERLLALFLFYEDIFTADDFLITLATF